MSSQKHLPPTPPASRSDKGPGDVKKPDPDTSIKKGVPGNPEQARQGNINQNTHHQGYQQDR